MDYNVNEIIKNDNAIPKFYSLPNDTATDISRMAKNTQLDTLTKIDVGAQSQLTPVAGSWVQVFFEVTNLHNVPIRHAFLLADEQRLLRELNLVGGYIDAQFPTCSPPPHSLPSPPLLISLTYCNFFPSHLVLFDCGKFLTF